MIPKHKTPEETVPDTGVNATVPVTAEEPRKSKHRSQIQGFQHLLEAVYVSKRPPSRLRNSEVVAIESSQSIGDDRTAILELATKDVTLDRTKHLLLVGVGLQSPSARVRVKEIGREVLISHPAFQAGWFSSYIRGDATSSITTAIKSLTSQNFAQLAWRTETPLKKGQLDRCKKNALQCLLLFVWLNGDTSLRELIYELRSSVWSRVATGGVSESKAAAALIQSRDPAVPLLYEAMAQERSRIQGMLDASRSDGQAAVLRAQKAERRRDELDEKVEAQETEIQTLKARLEMALADLTNYKAISTNEYENLRGRILGKLRSELTLLDEGLHALQREPPKIHVMIDHAERAIDGLKAEINRLED